jgi:hypothetical protein
MQFSRQAVTSELATACRYASKGCSLSCHCEANHFKKIPILKAAFFDNQNCEYTPDEDILRRCIGIANSPLAKKRLEGNEAAIFIPAIAASKNQGVISDHRSVIFMTTFDLCIHFGIPILSADEYFEDAL